MCNKENKVESQMFKAKPIPISENAEGELERDGHAAQLPL